MRKVAVVGCALTISAMVLRPQVSSALVTRGDDLAYRGDAARARMMYARALALDTNNLAALDRFAFSAMMSHDRLQVSLAIPLLNPVLARHPSEVNLRLDRALCEQALNRRADAARDFEYIGLRTRDARALTFAALDTNDRTRARALLDRAIAYDPRFIPALKDLTRLERRRRWR